jgi:predicted ribosomally synthesized peptide with SipW-like signal peptide
MSLKKKISGAVMATALGAALIGGGSYALFTAEAVNSGNTFTTGGVTIDDVNSTLTATQYFDNLAPGDSEGWTVTIENKDTLDAWVRVADNGYTLSGDLFSGATPLTIAGNTQVVKIDAGQSKTFNFTYSFPEGAGNEYQGDTGELDIKFIAVQAKNNTNAAGNGPISWE